MKSWKLFLISTLILSVLLSSCQSDDGEDINPDGGENEQVEVVGTGDFSWLVMPTFNSIVLEENAPIMVQNQDMHWGIIDLEGNYLLDPVFEILIAHQEISGKIFQLVYENERAAILDENGDYFSAYNDEVVLPTDKNATLIPYYEDSKLGYKDIEGEVVIFPMYLYGGEFVGDYAPVQTENGFGAIDKMGNLVLDNVWDHVSVASNGYFIIGRESDDGSYNYGIADENGNTRVAPRYANIIEVGANAFGFITKSEWDSSTEESRMPRYGVMLASGIVVQETKYTEIVPFGSGAYAVDGEDKHTNTNVSLLDSNGAVLSSYENVSFNLMGDSVMLDSEELLVFYSESGQPILVDEGLKEKSEFAGADGANYALFEKLDIPSTELVIFNGNVARFKTESGFGLCNLSGEVLLEPKYDRIEHLDMLQDSGEIIFYLEGGGKAGIWSKEAILDPFNLPQEMQDFAFLEPFAFANVSDDGEYLMYRDNDEEEGVLRRRDETYEIYIEAQFEHFAQVEKISGKTVAVVIDDSKCGIIEMFLRRAE